MSDVVENVSEQNSAQNNEATAPSTETVEDVTQNNADATVKVLPEVINENDNGSGSKDSPEKSPTSPKMDKKKTPVKRTPSKRMTFIERAQKESEELVKNMGGSLEIEGGRRTRSSARGTPTRSVAASTPPPVKKARSSPASGSSTPTRPRGRGRKLDAAEDANEDEESKPTPSKKKSPTKGKNTAVKKAAEEEEVLEEKCKEEEIVKKATDAETKLEEEIKEKAVADNSIETPTSDQTKEEDTTDAALEPVVEETQSQTALADLESTEKNVTNESGNKKNEADVILELSESVKRDSPMDTDIENVVEKSKEEVRKPTPEPMEIDSSSNSNDVIEINADTNVVRELTKPLENSEQSTTALNNIEKVVEASIESSVVPPTDNIAKNAKKSVAVVDVGNANGEKSKESTVANNDTNKTENDLCEPKIATSPPILASNESNSVTTPQTCN